MKRNYEDLVIKMDEKLYISGLVLRIDKLKKPRPML